MIININKTTGEVVDVGQHYDARFFDNAEYPDGTIPAGARPEFYKRLGDGSIALASQAEIEEHFEDELRKRLKTEILQLVGQLNAAIDSLPAGVQKQIVTGLLQLIRKVTLLLRLE